MSTIPDFTSVRVDIVRDVIESRVLTGKYRGAEVWEKLELTVKETKSDQLLMLDIRLANPLDYPFCQTAFGPLLKFIQQNGSNKMTLFQMHEYHKSCFFRGLLKFINLDLPRDRSIDGFYSTGMFAMIMSDPPNIEYVSKLSTTEQELLSLVRKSGSISGRDIVAAKQELHTEDIVDGLRSLTQKGFVLHVKNDTDYYHAIETYLK